jgi:hypothetical protein
MSCTAGTSPSTSVRSLADGKVKADRWAQQAVDATFPPELSRTIQRGDVPGVESQGTRACDPQDGHHLTYGFEIAVKVPSAKLDDDTLSAWRNLESEGFSMNDSPEVKERVDRGVPSGPESPTAYVILSTQDGFGGQVIGNRIDSVVYVGVYAPCFDTNA